MIETNIELANHICNEIHGLDFDEVLERIKKIHGLEAEVSLSPEELDKITEEFRTFYGDDMDF